MSEDVQVEPQSNTGKWILLFLAIVFVAASVYGYVTTQQHVDKLTRDLSASQAQVAELQKHMQSAEAQEETLGQKLGMTKKELTQRAAALQAEQRAAESRL
jgi:peptidoglycan hydrolase CwlO-like protein